MTPVGKAFRQVAAALFLVLAGCAASQQPLTPLSEALAEPGLLGTWSYAGPENDAYEILHVLPGRSANSFDIVAVNSAEGMWLAFEAHATALGDKRFLSVRILTASAKAETELPTPELLAAYPYSFVAYRLLGDGSLELANPWEQLDNAVGAGDLLGTRGNGDLLIADTSTKIRSILERIPAAELFLDPMVYRRSPPRR